MTRPDLTIGRRSLLRATAAAPLLAAPFLRPAAAADKPVRVGVLTDMSSWGKDNSGPGSVEAAKMAAEQMKGMAGGRKVEVLVGDHQMNPNIGLQIARKWFDEGGVDAIADVPNSAIGIAVSGLAAEKNKVALLSGPGASVITGKLCNANTVQFTYDTYALAKVTGSALVGEGKKKWFFITADYAFGHALEKDATDIVNKLGGQVVGHALHPTGTTDFSAFLLQAQASKADVVALANAGQDTDNALKQAGEFGLAKGGQTVTGLLMFLTDVHAVGLRAAQGTLMTVASYWDMTPETRAWSEIYFKRVGMMPTFLQSGVYGAVLHYLKAIDVTKSMDTAAIMAEMQKMPINDPFCQGYLRKDGRVIRDMYLMRVKTPEQSKRVWDYLELVKTVKGEDAYRTVAESECKLLKS
jgi:branched-chain amino acid transport system substrate-binding protein